MTRWEKFRAVHPFHHRVLHLGQPSIIAGRAGCNNDHPEAKSFIRLAFSTCLGILRTEQSGGGKRLAGFLYPTVRLSLTGSCNIQQNIREIALGRGGNLYSQQPRWTSLNQDALPCFNGLLVVLFVASCAGCPGLARPVRPCLPRPFLLVTRPDCPTSHRPFLCLPMGEHIPSLQLECSEKLRRPYIFHGSLGRGWPSEKCCLCT